MGSVRTWKNVQPPLKTVAVGLKMDVEGYAHM